MTEQAIKNILKIGETVMYSGKAPKISEADIFRITIELDEELLSNDINEEKGTEKGTEKITTNQQKIVDSISENPNITSEELSIIVGIRADKIRVNLSKLKSKGIIKRIGADKGGYWEINVENRK